MPQEAWSNKRERQYEHVKDSAKKRGASTKRAKEIAARTVNKERARSGEARTSSRRSTRAVRSHRRPLGQDEGAALQPGEAPEHQGPLEDEQATAAGRGQPEEIN